MSTCVGVDARVRLVEESAACAAGLLPAALAAEPDEDAAPGVGRRSDVAGRRLSGSRRSGVACRLSGSRVKVLLGGECTFLSGSSEPVAPA